MGTSQSNPGPGGNSPLVPPWADDEPQEPLPQPDPSRFRGFRRSVGKFIRSGDRGDLRSALRNYARTATGGGGVAARRMGGVTKAGASLYGTLSGASGDSVSGSPIDLNRLTGLSCDAAIDAITKALSTTDGDSDKIRVAMNHALVEALDGVTVFDPKQIDQDTVTEIMINYVAESIFLQVVTDAGTAWSKADTPIQAIEAENALRELIKVLVDRHMATKMNGNTRRFNTEEITIPSPLR